jgi:hypothetical protein
VLSQYCSGDKIEKNKMDGACSAYGATRGVYRVLVGKPEGKGPLAKPGVDGSIIIRKIFRMWNGEYRLE